MAVLDKVMQLQQQGMQESEIVNHLRNEGNSTKDINDAMNQAKIKSAVTQDPYQNNQQQYSNPGQMRESIMQQEQAPQEQQESTEQLQQYEPQQYEMYQGTPQAYGEGYYEQPQITTNTVSEIAEQVVSEKIQKLQDKIGDIASFKYKIEESLKDLDERITKIEDSIDHLEKSIIRKVGEFGESNAMVHKDLENMHNTMAKLMNPLMDNYQELKKLAASKR